MYIIIILIGYTIAHRMNKRTSLTVGRLNTINLINRQDRDHTGRRLYNALKTLDGTPSNSIKNFDDLVLEDIASEKIVLILNDHV